jgi:NAD(P)-dependent dehydrogenase (short-subunit alcohol dehydrogenase family)
MKKISVVSGGASGLGLEIADLLVKSGKNKEKGQSTKAKVDNKTQAKKKRRLLDIRRAVSYNPDSQIP